VKIATQEILHRKPDLCVSGINHGSNSSINVIYSGTMSAAVEAGIEGIPAIGFSLTDYSLTADFEPTKKFVKAITKNVIKNGLPKGVVLNVNLPKLPEKEIKGIKVCRQAKAYWVEEFDKRTNPQGRDYYWLTGEFVNKDKGRIQMNGPWQTVMFRLFLYSLTSPPTTLFRILNSWDLND
jgi:5'-nucleotidase